MATNESPYLKPSKSPIMRITSHFNSTKPKHKSNQSKHKKHTNNHSQKDLVKFVDIQQQEINLLKSRIKEMKIKQRFIEGVEKENIELKLKNKELAEQNVEIIQRNQLLQSEMEEQQEICRSAFNQLKQYQKINEVDKKQCRYLKQEVKNQSEISVKIKQEIKSLQKESQQYMENLQNKFSLLKSENEQLQIKLQESQNNYQLLEQEMKMRKQYERKFRKSLEHTNQVATLPLSDHFISNQKSNIVTSNAKFYSPRISSAPSDLHTKMQVLMSKLEYTKSFITKND